MIRVLVLDDDPLVAHWLADQLQLESDVQIQAVVASTPEEAMQLVQGDAQPFDAFLIDERLGAGKDGIVAMEDLKRLRPDAEAIIFTGFDDPEVGYRALQAGAWCYLPKTDGLMPELVWRLRWLQGLRMLEEATRRAQRAESLKEVADVIVQSARQIGFERARLWRVDGAAEAWVNGAAGHDGITQTLVALAAAGECAPVEMPKEPIPLDRSPYAGRALASPAEVTRFHGEELGPGYLARQKRAEGYRPPVGDWLVAPLRAEGRPVGLLVLDNLTQAHEITREQLQLLQKFCRVASLALERAWRHERRRLLNEIGARIMTQAAHSDLDKLLKRLRQELGRFTNAHNFIAALVEEEGNRRYLHYRVRYEDGRCQQPVWRPLSEPGLLAHVVERNGPVFAPDAARYRAEHGLQAFGTPARSWMGAPLRVKGRAVGVIALENNRKTNAFTQTEFEQFVEVVAHVQGAIQVARLEEQQEQNSRRLRLLQRASEEMMKLVDKRDEAALWLAALTAATADYGLQFNRAALFLARDGGAKVIGRAGVGHFDLAEARAAWWANRESRMDFDRFLAKLRQGTLEPTPLHRWVCEQVIDLSLQKGHAFQNVLHTGRPMRIPAGKAARRLPEPFVARFGAHDCALVPLRAGSRVIGLVVVDNAHDGKPIRKLALDYLESLLAHAALIYEDHRQRKAHERLNALTCDILSHASRPSLKDTLAEICRVALDVAGVDCASIVPATESGAQVTYDVERAGHAGWQKVLDPVRTPRPDGITEHVLRAGRLVVPDIGKHEARYAGKPIGEHPVLREEGVRALICAPVRAVETGETLGALRLYWRSPQAFDQPELTQAEMFARLAAVAIQNWRAAQQTRAAAEAAEAEAQTRERELAIHRRVMSAALQPDASQEDVVRALLDAARDILNLPRVVVEVNLREWEPSDDPADSEPREIRREYFLDASGALQCDREPDPFRGVIGRALCSGQTQPAHDVTAPEWRESFYDVHGRATRSQLVAPILRGDARDPAEAIGALNAESPVLGAFGEAHARALERLASVAALALDNARCLEGRRRVLETAHEIAAPINLSRTLGEIQRVVRAVAPDLSVLTIWHVDLGAKAMKLGTHFGVRDLDALYAEHADEGGIIHRVLNRERPIFVSQAEGHLFSSDFVRREGIRAFAALPLRAEGQSVGVMFLSYRHPHCFTPEERFLFETLAGLAASSIRDAALVEFATQEYAQRELVQQVAEVAATAFSTRPTSGWTRSPSRIQQAAELTATTFSKDEALRRIMALLKEHYPHAYIAIYTYERAEHVLKVTPASLDFYPFEDVSETGTLQIGDSSIAGHVARLALETRDFQLYNCLDARSDPYFLKGTEGMNSELCVSLMSVQRDLLGVLILESPNPEAFDEDDERQIRGIARQISLVLERAELGDRLVYQTALAMATGGFVDLEHVARSELLKIRRRAAWLSRKEATLSEQGSSWLREIDESAERLRLVLNEARAGNPDAPLEPTPCDPLIRDVVEEACRRRPAANLKREFDLNCGDALVEVNCKALRWALDHLVGNALDAMKGNGRLTVRTRLRAGQWAEVR
ncbi:MAG: GAF domain-containing protein, partial [Anaerolineae bacterium]|nr:GAF domain-containing protein [Candidatus Roseilinea sp.]MDW8451829.1 GAF domain-containing protein [Anaerolineae bacterium]